MTPETTKPRWLPNPGWISITAEVREENARKLDEISKGDPWYRTLLMNRALELVIAEHAEVEGRANVRSVA